VFVKNNIRYIVFSYILLAFFSIGQLAAYFHEHPVKCDERVLPSDLAKHTKTLDYKCNVCHLMDHSHMIFFESSLFSSEYLVQCDQIIHDYHYDGIQLIATAGRAPPTV
jgi:hypothetical protein